MIDLNARHECPYGPEILWTVYLVKSADLHKIGISFDLQKRIRSLRNSSAVPVKHIAHAVVCCPVRARAIESRLHERYSHLRRHGEWFQLHDVEVQDITSFLKSPWIDLRRRRRAEVNHKRRMEKARAYAAANSDRFERKRASAKRAG